MSQGRNSASPHAFSVPTLAEHQLLECIRHAQQQYLRATDARTLFTELLDDVLTLTESGYGFIAEVHYKDGVPYLKSRALTNIAWDKATRDFYRRHALQGLEFHKLNSLYGAVLTTRQTLISNSPAQDPRRGGLPPGHPALNSFMGLPLLCGDELIGMIGVANRAQGYDQALIDYLRPLLETTALLIQAYRQRIPPRAEAAPLLRLRENSPPRDAHAVQPETSPSALLEDIAAAFAAHTGEDCLNALAQALAELLGTDSAFISLLAAEPDTAELVVFRDRGRNRENFRYKVPGSPCEEVIACGHAYYADGLAARFPHSVWSSRFALESYAGVALADAGGKTVGVVAVAHRGPFPAAAHASSVLRIFAARIGIELRHRHVQERLRTLSLALEHTADAVMITDHANRIEYINPAYTAMTGLRAEEVLGTYASLTRADNQVATLTAEQPVRDVFISRKKDGELFYEEKTITPLKDASGLVTHHILTGKDITERMQTQERLHRLVHFDPLTGLPNRRLFLERLSHALARAVSSGVGMAVLCLDVDRLKAINETLGRESGDRTLQALAERLLESCRAGDTVARLDGDEFAVLIEDVGSECEVLNAVNKILAATSQVLRISGREVYATLCIGIAFSPTDGDDALTLLSHADAALARAKQRGRQAYHFYSADLSARVSQQLDMETRLRRALDRREFHLCYQPQLDLVQGRIVGVEALLRWQSPDATPVGPGVFIPALEDTGLIVPVGEWVLLTACRQAAQWRALGVAPLRMAVNVSGRQLAQRDFLPFLQRTLAEVEYPADGLELEITESVLMQDDPVTQSNFGGLRKMGVRIAIDDFGTGYSSLGYLKRFDVEALKIDRSFVRDVTHNKDDSAIIAAIIAMAHSLGLDVIAEGIETREQLHMLRRLGCRYSQGFLFSPPLSDFGLIPLLQPLSLRDPSS